ncbi:phosphodiester glycosidase family protein [Streptomyces sp. NBC_00335]|uniref:phosphodiester glycosidase family protein n=1 Tax=unclassified Streptomyces TaxID=2593676 RepID=UPI00225A2381|nr:MULTISPECIES: phosphodiester glycosidase family protein [unclassified Streptomyces]MCX5403847.1 phosphodiester glycosidase family protein [Streptomyces sp. NBC_00086]
MLTIKRPIIKRTATTGAAVLLLTASAVLGAPAAVYGATAGPTGLELAKLVPTSTDVSAPGITRTTYSARTGGPWNVNVVVIDPDLAPLTLKGTFGTALATSQTSSSMLKDVSTTTVRRPRVGINGAFFDGNVTNPANGTHDGDPSGIVVRGGKLLSEAAKGKGSKPVGSALVLQHGRARIAELSTTLKVQPKNGPLKQRQLDGINRVPGRNAHCEGPDPIDKEETFDKDGVCRDLSEIVSFTPEYAGATPTTAFLASSNDPDNPSVGGVISTDEGIEVLLDSGNKVTECYEPAPAKGSTCKIGNRGGRNVPSGGRILQGTGDGTTWLRDNAPVGAELEFPETVFDTRIADTLTLDPSMYVTPGGDLLLKNGKIDYKQPAAGSPDPNPRTAVASDATGRIMLVTVDGDDATVSKGATRLELATLLKDLGAVDALNMDGGGSTTLVWQNTVVNHPSDGNEQERPVADTVFAGVGGYPLA